jgi:hypothetical protein
VDWQALLFLLKMLNTKGKNWEAPHHTPQTGRIATPLAIRPVLAHIQYATWRAPELEPSGLHSLQSHLLTILDNILDTQHNHVMLVGKGHNLR